MIKYLLVCCLAITTLPVMAQQINGQWRGFFNSKGDIVMYGSDNTEYVLELDIKGKKVTGFSYSYFQGRKYYVICKLDGTYYPATKSIKVIETERVKGNTPPDFQDCFQVHYLTYQKEGKAEQLSGRWITAPGQQSSCGEGATTLSRRTLDKSLSRLNKSSRQQPVVKKPAAPGKAIARSAQTAPPVAKKQAPALPDKVPGPPPAPAPAEPVKPTPAPVIRQETVSTDVPAPSKEMNFEKRKADIVKTIEIENETFRVDLYDNGEVDGDSISLFYNNKLILSKKRLSAKPLTLNLDATSGDAINELTMYAENLGEIPPNTALMVVTDGDKRYEVRIASDLKNSGTIRFIHKKRSSQ